MHGAIARAAAERPVGAAGAGRRRGTAARRQCPTRRDHARIPRRTAAGRPARSVDVSRAGSRWEEAAGTDRRARAPCGPYQPGGASEGGAWTGTGRAAAGRIYPGARENHQRKPEYAETAHRESAIGTGVRRHVETLRRAHAAAASAGERERRSPYRIGFSISRCSPPRR